MLYQKLLAARFSILFVLLVPGNSISRDAQTVDKWAETIGSDLWDLASAVARPDDIKERYKELNARVEDKSGKELIEIISESVGRMLRRKMDAVRRILWKAEKAAENFNDASITNWTDISNETAFAQDLPYYSGKYSPVVGEPPPLLPESIKNNSYLYKEMELTPDSHFYNIPVNTNYSAVHVPTNIFDLARDVNIAIQWSKELDEVFRKNYRADPALSWQYFGSTSGILRLYPAMQWRVEESKPDRYDCRMRSWFIESATCSKHMVILMDLSGSMQGMSYTIAKATAGEILDTLSNNDFVTIIGFSNVTYEMVECFNNTLVQATPENIEIFKRHMARMPITEPADLNLALNKAFDLLESYRNPTFCGTATPCTQAIMLVTDGVSGNLTEVYRERNRLENGTHIPVRIFTYLLGRDVTKVREIQWMACMNKGYYSHVHTVSEVREQVLKYIPVIARPLVLQQVDHPLIWTHAYADISNPALATWLWLVMEHPEQKSRLIKHLKGKQQGVEINEDAIYITKHVENDDTPSDPSAPKKTAYQEYKLLTSVSVPAYDRKINSQNGTRVANLLGVAATDVSLDEINRLTLPYKLGVNGYAFIVSNNGYVILHPDLRPAWGGELKRNYNSIDLTEVEVIDDDSGPRNPGKVVMDLRWALVNHSSGNITGIPVKIHYDDYRRVTIEKRDYFFAPLPETPFGLAVALPDYGTTWIKVGDEIMKNQNMKVRIMDFFLGNRWRVHPTWVYCRFHYLEGHEFDTPEQEMRYFLKALDEPGWYWAEQYEEPDNKTKVDNGENDEDEYVDEEDMDKDEYEDEDENLNERSSINYITLMEKEKGRIKLYMTDEDDEERKPACSQRNLDDDAYYCNKELMQLLVFDAKATNSSFSEKFDYSNEVDRELGKAYGVFLRFVATQSGLTRWQDVSDAPTTEKPPTPSDGEANDIKLEFGDLHRRAVNEPWYKGAIFQHNIDPESISLTVPSVAGPNAIVTVAQGIFPKDGGKEAPAAVVGFQMPMKSFYQRFLNVTSNNNRSQEGELTCANEWIDCYLIDQNGYVVISDSHNDTGKFLGIIEGAVMESLVYQGVYKAVEIYDYQALCLSTAIIGAAGFLETPIHHLAQLLTWFIARLIWLTSQLIDLPETWARKSASEDAPDPPPPPEEVTVFYACDEKRTLYILQQDVAQASFTNISILPTRPFFAEKVPHTNLLLVVVKTMYSSPYVRLEVDPEELTPQSYPTGVLGAPCHKLDLNKLPRRALQGCYTEHPLEQEIEDCGAGANTNFQFSRSTISLMSLMLFLAFFRCTAT